MTVLVIAPHPDDETLALGGTIAKHVDQGDDVAVLFISGHLPPLYQRDSYETTVREAKAALEILGVGRSRFLEIPTGLLAAEPPGRINAEIVALIEELRPATVYCPFPDRHVDHRVTFDCAMVATRPVGPGRDIRLLAAYETLSETHWNAPGIEPVFAPSMIVDITAQLERKLKAVKCYASQIRAFPGARSVEAVEALATFRGTQAGFAHGEALHVIRLIR
jgi:LmbE family N-acetylglucosaminyl deacetylase